MDLSSSPPDMIGVPAAGRTRSGARKLVTMILRGVAGASAVGLCIGFVVFADAVTGEEPTDIPHAEGIIALTGGADRIAEAMALLAAGRGDRLLITGVNQSTTSPEIAGQTPQYKALFQCCVDLGYEALNTIGNAREAAQWAARRDIRHSLIIVTSSYHMPRALAEMRHVLPDVQLHPYPVVPERLRRAVWWRDVDAARLVAREYLKYIVTVARLYLLDAPPDTERRLASLRERKFPAP